MIRLPKVGERGEYRLPCGSRIYPSGTDYEREGIKTSMPDKGKFFLWVMDGSDTITGVGPSAGATTTVIRGHIVTTASSLRYFKTPREALEFLGEVREGTK